MDKTEEINKRLIYLKKVISDEDEMPYEILHRTLEEIDKIISLVEPKEEILKSYTQNTSRILQPNSSLITETKLPKLDS